MDFISFYSNLEKKAKKVEVTEKTFQFISFNLGNEEYAIEMLSIKEIVEIPYITRVPKAPYYVVGVMNLRGYIVPIVDLRRRFNIPESRFDEGERKIIILEGINKDRHVGIIVDRVNEVVTVPESRLEAPSSMISGIDREFISKLAKLQDGRIVIVLDSYRLMM